jgi:hypothetical protein
MHSKQAVHVVMGIMPSHYPYLVNYFHGVVTHRSPFVEHFGTMMTREKLREFKQAISKYHGDAVQLRETHHADHINLTMAYSPRHFNDENAVMTLVEKARNLAINLHRESGLVPPDQC